MNVWIAEWGQIGDSGDIIGVYKEKTMPNMRQLPI